MRRFLAFWLFRWANVKRHIGLRTRNRQVFLIAEALLTRTLQLNDHHLQARVNRGLLRWRELDNWAGAITDFTTILAQFPEHYEALFYRGMAFYRGGDYRKSAEDLLAFIRLAPNSRWIHHAIIQLNGLQAILDDLPKLLPASTEPQLTE